MTGEEPIRAGRALPAFAYRRVVRAWALALGLVGWCLFVGLSPAGAVVHTEIPAAVRTLASGLFLIAGILLLVRWWLVGGDEAARTAAVLIILGVALRVHPLIEQSGPIAQIDPGGHTLCLAAVFALLLPGERWSRLRHAGLYRLAFAVAVVLALAVAGALFVRTTRPNDLTTIWVVVDSAAALCWLTMAMRPLGKAAAPRGMSRPWVCTVFSLMAVAELMSAWSLTDVVPAIGMATGLEFAAGVIMVSVAGSDLLRTVREGDSEASATSKVLVDLRERLSDVEQAQRNRLHDARSAIMGVLAASDMLLQAGEHGPTDTSRLNQLMARELRRLQSVLDSETVEPIAQFDLAEALNPVVTIHQLDGSTISVQLHSLPVIGRPRATATVLDNLLRNARVHAPGSNVTVRAEQVGAVATVVVEDDGPGIPPSEYEQVLRPGVRGSSAAVPGSGLGLSNAVDAMRRQGGALNVSGRVGGGTRVTLTLPVALTGPDTRALAS